jgi:hypothetical protein
MTQRNAILLAIVALVVLAAAGGAWYYSGRATGTSVMSAEDARVHRAEQACLSNTDSKAGGKVDAKAGAESNAVTLGAGVESSDVHKRGPGEAVGQDQYLNEANAIRACMKDYLMKEDAAK